MDEHIKSNKRKIFWGVAVYVGVIALITAAFGAWILTTYDNLAGRLALAGFVLFDLVMIRIATSSGMWIVRWVLRATTVYPGGAGEAKDAVDDICIATGMPAPEIMLIDEDFRNALSLKDRRRAVLIVTSGLIRDLDDDELRAVVAHEMAHLYNEDSSLNTFIASLRGFSLIAHSVFDHVRYFVDSPIYGPVYEVVVLPALILFTILMPVLVIFFGKGSSEVGRIILSTAIIVVLNLLILVIFGRVMQWLVDPYREMHADELAVAWTMYPEAMVRALRKVAPHCSAYRLGFLKGMFFGPITVFRYLTRRQVDLQPTIDERIDNLERVLHTPLEPRP